MSLAWVPPVELERIRALDADPAERVAVFADACRLNVLSMVMRAGSGHLGTSFSCIDMLAWLHLEVVRDGDRVFSSKGHDAPAVYAVLAGLGRIPFEKLKALRRLGGLPGHPDVKSTPDVVTNTGSLGMGVSKARGFVLADRLAGRAGRVFVITGDGELQEGQFWESLQPTANRSLGEITVLVDHNKIQSDTWVETVSDLGDLEEKVAVFGWATSSCDGNDVAAFARTLGSLEAAAPDRPKLIVAHTRKGAGVSFMEPHALPLADTSLYRFHSGAPSLEDYAAARSEIHERLDARLHALGAAPVRLEEEAVPVRVAPVAPQRLVAAYGDELLTIARGDQRVVALDADLRLDTGLVAFREGLPERFIECGIAEQDMVSQAGAMALSGLLPVVHSFACFLTPRANEQIFNNGSEGTRVVYSGSLAGIVPGGPGHSHQSVRDIALMGSVPGMACIEPYCEAEARAAIRWALRETDGPVYIRLVTPPWDLGFEPPASGDLAVGRGTVLRTGTDGGFVATGPVLVSQAWKACELLAAEGISFGLVALPWLRAVDGGWLAGVIPTGAIVTLDNHVAAGGQGEAVLAALAAAQPEAAARVHAVAIDRTPVCGTNDEVLHAHGLDAAALAGLVRTTIARQVARAL